MAWLGAYGSILSFSTLPGELATAFFADGQQLA